MNYRQSQMGWNATLMVAVMARMQVQGLGLALGQTLNPEAHAGEPHGLCSVAGDILWLPLHLHRRGPCAGSGPRTGVPVCTHRLPEVCAPATPARQRRLSGCGDIQPAGRETTTAEAIPATCSGVDDFNGFSASDSYCRACLNCGQTPWAGLCGALLCFARMRQGWVCCTG